MEEPAPLPQPAARVGGPAVPGGSSLTWRSSAGSGARNAEAVLKLHRLRFVERRGHDAGLELIEERRKHNCQADLELQREHAAKVRSLKEAGDERLKSLNSTGSFSHRSKEERAREEEARREHLEARDEGAQRFQQLASTHREELAAMTARVSTRPDMSTRTREDLRALEAKRTDPEEAEAATKKRHREKVERHLEEHRAMSARVAALPRTTFRNRARREEIEERRLDLGEAAEKHAQRVQERARWFEQEAEAMMSRVAATPHATFWTKEERAALEEVRQETEASIAMRKQRAQEFSAAHAQDLSAMRERVQATPRATFWTKEERQQIEELRGDPDELRARAEQQARERAEAYRQDKKEMAARVAAIPKSTFLDPEHHARRRHAEALRLRQPQASVAAARKPR
mmetsp:Transcript_66577/g.186057  ORF Transcript_66577/g.186057 Transcript_66577/m.186057 type:complete len:403 (+) Transcript_66577:73-1281(+)